VVATSVSTMEEPGIKLIEGGKKVRKGNSTDGGRGASSTGEGMGLLPANRGTIILKKVRE